MAQQSTCTAHEINAFLDKLFAQAAINDFIENLGQDFRTNSTCVESARRRLTSEAIVPT